MVLGQVGDMLADGFGEVKPFEPVGPLGVSRARAQIRASVSHRHSAIAPHSKRTSPSISSAGTRPAGDRSDRPDRAGSGRRTNARRLEVQPDLLQQPEGPERARLGAVMQPDHSSTPPAGSAVARPNLLACRHQHFSDDPVAGRRQRMFHLHRLQHRQPVAWLPPARGHVDRLHQPRHRRQGQAGAGSSRSASRGSRRRNVQAPAERR